jgi:hypothetical protein
MKSIIFCDIRPCSALKVNRHFWGIYRLHLQASNLLSRWYFALFIRPWIWERYTPPVRLSPLCKSATNWPIVSAPDDTWWVWSSWQGTPKYSEKTCLSDTLSTTNPTLSDLGSNPGLRGTKPATNLLRYGTAYVPPKRRLTSNGLHVVISLQTVLFFTYIQFGHLVTFHMQLGIRFYSCLFHTPLAAYSSSSCVTSGVTVCTISTSAHFTLVSNSPFSPADVVLNKSVSGRSAALPILRLVYLSKPLHPRTSSSCFTGLSKLLPCPSRIRIMLNWI